MQTADFDFELPPELIAQSPAVERDQSRLLVLHRRPASVEHRRFMDLPDYLRAGDVLVLNDSRVIPARLRGVNATSGGQFEMLLLEGNATNDWWAMVRPGKRARNGTRIVLRDARGNTGEVQATVLEKNDEGHRRLRFTGALDISEMLDTCGEAPLPPYIRRPGAGPTREDRERYQTVFARAAGSVAAPTAGLHFTGPLLETIRAREVQVCFVTLHVGLGTFAPVKTERLVAHRMHSERFELSEETSLAVNHAKREGRRVIAVGTTTLRVLESAAGSGLFTRSRRGEEAETCGLTGDSASSRRQLRGASNLATASTQTGAVVAGIGRTNIFIHPPYDFKIVDALLTNFHLPRSTLLMLASAFAAPGGSGGRDIMLSAYAEAIRERYRFFSYGDAMLIV